MYTSCTQHGVNITWDLQPLIVVFSLGTRAYVIRQWLLARVPAGSQYLVMYCLEERGWV